MTRDMWHVTRDMWHVTCDMWHMTRDTWHMTHDTWHMTPTQPPHTHTHTPHPHIWGDVKKTSPMNGEVFFSGDIQKYTHTDRRTSWLYDWIGPVGRFSENCKTKLYILVSFSSERCTFVYLKNMHVFREDRLSVKFEGNCPTSSCWVLSYWTAVYGGLGQYPHH